MFDLDFGDLSGFDFGGDAGGFDYGNLDLGGLEGGFEFPGYGGMTPGQIFEPASLGFTLRNFATDYGGALLDLVGRGAPGVAGAFAANQQANAYKDLSDKWLGFGAPSRSRYDASYMPGFSMMNEPGYAQGLEYATRTALNRNSVGTGLGGVASQPNAMFGAMRDVYSGFTAPALQSYRSSNSNTGGYNVFNAAAPNAASGAVDAKSHIWNSAGGGLGDVFSPPRTTLSDLLRGMK